jgi:hypothetical protein
MHFHRTNTTTSLPPRVRWARRLLAGGRSKAAAQVCNREAALRSETVGRIRHLIEGVTDAETVVLRGRS